MRTESQYSVYTAEGVLVCHQVIFYLELIKKAGNNAFHMSCPLLILVLKRGGVTVIHTLHTSKAAPVSTARRQWEKKEL